MSSCRRSIGAMALAMAWWISPAGAQVVDFGKYPDVKGQWVRIGAPRWDTSKPALAQGAPLTPEYQAIFEAGLADVAQGGQGTNPTATCLAPGMPRSMNVYHPMEIVITPETVHILIDHTHDFRRIYTDGRDWPTDEEPTFAGYSIGKWIDTDGDGRYDVLEVETRQFKGPRTFDSTGIPLHRDNQTIVKERIYLDKDDRTFLYDEVTTIDHALTHPWTVRKKYQRDPSPRPVWVENICGEGNNHVVIGNEDYVLSADGLLMPTKKGQAAPDLRHFKQTQQ
jgi:hypothetical protein